jgi:hypothetical protein
VLGFALCAIQCRDRIFDQYGEVENLEAGKLCVGVVIGSVAKPLHGNEILSELLYFQRKGAHLLKVAATSSNLTMF